MKEKFYITTSIAYANSRPHVGFALELVQADVIARWQRQKGKDVFFLTGTDEHGVKNVRAAQKAGEDVDRFVDKNASIFKQLVENLGISSDDFMRTSDKKRHFPGAQELWKKMDASGDIFLKKYSGLYCVGHEAFITQKDLVNGKCADHDAEPEKLEEENYFFRLSKYAPRIKNALESGELKIFPESRRNEMLKFVERGLEDVSFSRPSKDISWGVPVPGDSTQTMYVWSDALANYLTGIGYGTDWNGSSAADERKKYWPADMHVLGKDILRFHALIWPGMLLSAGLPLSKSIFVHGFIHAEGRKMSKTIGNVIDPLDFIERYGKEPLRYYLLREIPQHEDGDFTEERFLEVYNADLANGLGNYVSRVAKMIEQYFGGVLEKPSEEDIDAVSAEGAVLTGEKMSPVSYIDNVYRPDCEKLMENYELKIALDSIFKLIEMLDGYVQQYQPFKLIKTDEEKTKAVLWNLSFGALSVALMLKPFLPDTADKIFEAFGVEANAEKAWQEIRVKLEEPLFSRKE